MRRATLGQFVLFVFACLAASAFVTGISGFRGGAVSRYHGWERLFPLIVAVVCFAWFAGLRSRRLWAWYVGCAVLILSILQVFIGQGVRIFISEGASSFGWWALVSQTLFAALLLLLLVRWWLPKRREFTPPPEPNHAMERTPDRRTLHS